MSPLSRFENFARELVEGSIDRLVGEQYVLVEVASALAAAAERSWQDDVLANRYTISMHPSTLSQMLLQTPDSAAILKDMIARLATEGNMVLAGEVQIDFDAEEAITEGKASIMVGFSSPQDEPTAVILRGKAPTAPLQNVDAYLIINGRRHVALYQVVTMIGRSLENDVVLEDPGVSRRHAQVRWRNGRFVIFDLGSRAGTIVNDRSIREQDLSSGDVIRLGGAAIIFGQEIGDEETDSTSCTDSDGLTQELSRDELP